jgi:hypothetical protein
MLTRGSGFLRLDISAAAAFGTTASTGKTTQPQCFTGSWLVTTDDASFPIYLRPDGTVQTKDSSPMSGLAWCAREPAASGPPRANTCLSLAFAPAGA